MASYFGEIIEPSTRAIFDDYSDDEECASKPELQLTWIDDDKKLPSVLDVIFVIHGRLSLAQDKTCKRLFKHCNEVFCLHKPVSGVATCYRILQEMFRCFVVTEMCHLPATLTDKAAFAEAYLLEENTPHSAEIKVIESSPSCEREYDEHSHKSLPSRLYVDGSKVFCFVSPTCPEELGFEFTETLLPLLKISKKVVVFTNESLYNYKTLTLNELPPAFIRELKTSSNSSKDAAKKLPTPNFISGIPAGVISWCQIFNKDGSAFVCYSDQEKLDSITATPYKSVIKNLSYDIIKTENPDFLRKSFYGKPGIICGSSNIYV